MFEEIDQIEWHQTDESSNQYLKKNHSEKENEKHNLKIKFAVIDSLVACNAYFKLAQLSKESSGNEILKIRLQTALAVLLLPKPSEKKGALKIIGDIDFTKLPDKSYFKLLTFCTDYLNNEEIKKYFPKRDISTPVFFEKVVVQARMTYKIRKEIINLYDNLKPIWIFQPELVPTLRKELLYLSSPGAQIYDSILTLSGVWNISRTKVPDENKILIQLKKSIKSLYIEHSTDFKSRASGLFDMDTDSSFIASSLKSIFEKIFGLAIELLSEAKLKELIDFWIQCDNSGDGYKHYNVGIAIARLINLSRYKKVSELAFKLIEHAEQYAREEHDTIQLTINLSLIAEAYGICGFEADFQRVYDQLIETAFGVGHRKDYQASNIIEPLRFLDQIDPENALARFSEVLYIQGKLFGAGNGRMYHICLSELLAYAAKSYPSLAFDLMQREEVNISRDETIHYITAPLIRNCPKEHLELYFSLIKTLPRWRNGGTSEGYFLQLSGILLSRAADFKDEEIILKIINLVKFNLLVELEEPKELLKFSEILHKSGIDYTVYLLPDPKISDTTTQNQYFTENTGNNISSKEKEEYNLDFNELLALLEDNYVDFEKHVQSKAEKQTLKSRNEELKKAYRTEKKLFTGFKETLSVHDKNILESSTREIIKKFAALKNSSFSLNPADKLSLSEFKKIVSQFFTEVDNLFAGGIFKIYLTEKLEINKMVANYLHTINSQDDFFSLHILSDDDILNLADECSLSSIDNLIDFVEKWTKRRIRSAALLKIAHRLIAFDLKKAKQVVAVACDFEFDSLLFPRYDSHELDFDLLEALLEADADFGKKFLLESYYIQNGRYGGDLNRSMKRLLKYQAYFESESVKGYYDANLQYNKQLAAGLPNKTNKYEHIAAHKETLTFPEIIIKHLVWLFNYPAVKVREEALKSSLELIDDQPGYLQTFINTGIKKGSDNEVEYSLVVLQALALKNPAVLQPFKDEFMSLLQKEHYNILETAKELLLLLNQSALAFLTSDELLLLQNLNSAAVLPETSYLFKDEMPETFICSSFQRELTNKINFNDKDSNTYETLFLDLISKGVQDYNMEQESEVHQNYNMNTNFDTIEIESPFYLEVKGSLNKIFHQKIKQDKFKIDFIKSIKNYFRVYDPSKLLYSVLTRPLYINWIPEKISKQDFLLFSDIGQLVTGFVKREQDYITLAEYGSQRVDRYSELSGTCYFEVRTFIKNNDYELSEMEKLSFTDLINTYSYEMPEIDHPGSFPIKQLQPLIQISKNSFRGEPDLINAGIYPDTFPELEPDEREQPLINTNNDDKKLKALRWINANTSSTDSRRYKPKSEGYTLKIKKEILIDYLKKNNLTLCYNVRLRRSADQYILEREMVWKTIQKTFVIDLDQ